MKKLIKTLVLLSIFILFGSGFNCSDDSTVPSTTSQTTSTTTSTEVKNLPSIFTVKVNENAIYTLSKDISIEVTATNCDQIMISETNSFTDAVWVPYLSYYPFFSYTLTSNPGLVKVYVKVKNSQNNLQSNSRSDSIYLIDREFIVVNNSQQDEKMGFIKVAEGTNAIGYCEINQYSSYASYIPDIIKEFDINIFPTVTKYFGQPHDVDGNGKIFILFYDFSSFAAGYYSPQNAYNMPGSNHADIIHVTADLLTSGAPSTIAHEFQHLCNYNQNVFIEGGPDMDTFLNEGLSVFSEEIVYNDQSFLYYYNGDYSQKITNGHPLVYWMQEYENYCLSYVFLGYLVHQAGTNSFCWDFTSGTNNSCQGAVDTAIKYGIIPTGSSWENLFEQFTLARMLNNPTGVYGFKNFYNIDSPQFSTQSNISLKPGGAIYKTLSGAFTPSTTSAHIDYLSVNQTSGTITFEAPYTGNIIIGYNKNTSDSNSGENVYISPERNVIAKYVNPEMASKYIRIPYAAPKMRDLPLNLRYNIDKNIADYRN